MSIYQNFVKKTNDSSNDFEISKSRLFRGNGVFAKKKIGKGSVIPSNFIAFINDGDFSYPKSFARSDLEKCFNSYKLSRNNHNIIDIDTSFSIANCDIMPGEELTRRYGEEKWMVWLCLKTKVFSTLPAP